jgi:hypothetical protein
MAIQFPNYDFSIHGNLRSLRSIVLRETNYKINRNHRQFLLNNGLAIEWDANDNIQYYYNSKFLQDARKKVENWRQISSDSACAIGFYYIWRYMRQNPGLSPIVYRQKFLRIVLFHEFLDALFLQRYWDEIIRDYPDLDTRLLRERLRGLKVAYIHRWLGTHPLGYAPRNHFF